ncbi:disulfide bond formation protein DsbD [Salegentibacter salinarum]|uniref:Disulfide bond formation protein DsbD n=1 Tax=Salegentibacter salinarum TaxID=447422 RepID=A0A2N0TWK3_9FLAO|nr:thioredoxin family protein [Salegentibacter salinarum]PKD19101.1 disulfide bond formation protein DsbD [Salegentibacter salinarum]SKB95516.1 thiol:disulfide interchange protein DsbD [Salegentibacter salinarum]
MKLSNPIFFLVLLLFGASSAVGQMMEAPQWEVNLNNPDAEPGEKVTIHFEAEIPDDWYMYSNDFDPDIGPLLTEFTFEESEEYELLGDIQPIGQKKKYDEIWEGEISYFNETANFSQEVLIKKDSPEFTGNIFFQICTDVTGQCIPFDTDFAFDSTGNTLISTGNEGSEIENSGISDIFSAQGNTTTKGNENVSAGENGEILEPFQNSFKTESDEDDQTWAGLLTFFFISFGAGLAALLTPCVFPMIPMTVTFFTKGSGGKKGKMNALLYGLFIIAIYTIVGTLFAVLFGAGFANFLSTHWLPNLLFFAIFLLFALSFFGMFEIRLPNKLVNRVDKQADRGGLVGIFFMAFTLVLVSFSCTGPIAGTILLQAASGEAIMPLIGMLGFSLAFAIPFTLFAFFPGWLSSLPKSGGWLNTVKVVLGFLELAFALKFLSMVDQVYHWNILDRDIYLALWIVIFALLGFYLLGKLVFPHEKKIESVSVPRLMSAILVFSFVVYLIPGLFGAPLKALSGYLPPMGSQDFNMVTASAGPELESSSNSCGTPLYSEFLELPHGIQGFFDYEQAVACAREQNKPLFIDFTGHGCVNCREMEANVWSDPEVLRSLKSDYVVVALYVDEKTVLPKDKWYTSSYDGKLKKTIGAQNMDFMIQKLNANAQPYYTLLGEEGELLAAPKGYDLDIAAFISFLDKGKEAFYKGSIEIKQD